RAYELQAVIGLDAHAVESILPSDASCEDIEVDKALSFLNGYIQESIEKGAQPYIPESERTGMLNISNFRNQDHHEASSHGLRFEAYELPKQTEQARIPPASLASTELVPVPEPMYPRESYQTTTVPSVSSDAATTELKLRLDGVQKRWGRQTHFPSTSTSNSTSLKTVNGITQVDGSNTANSRTRETYDSRKQVEISPEKQKLAASLFGGPSKTEKKSAAGHKSSKPSSHMVKSHAPKSSMEAASEKTSVQQPPDLLDFGEPAVKSTAPSLDPFKDLEGLLEPTTQVSSAVNHSSTAAVTKSPDIMGLYTETTAGAHHKDSDILSGLSNPPMTNMVGGTTTMQVAQSSKGPNLKDSLEKDALVRQMGVTPSSQNPNLFKDLLG
ncbi:hypothetical protein Goshw_024680, partial [Gossypium schwendimanii]|nr:hypothetical protein [Gossypium schwendimanii]